MNHFFLWVGNDSENARLGRALLTKHKATEDSQSLSGRNWSITFAAQENGLGAYRSNRIRRLRMAGQDAESSCRLLWLGHAWSASDGNQPPIRMLETDATRSSAVKLISKARENCDGVFAMLIIDEMEQTISIASDLMGSFHIYYRIFSHGVGVSSSSAILAGLRPTSALDPLGMQEFCSNAVANEDRCLWKEVKKLRAGLVLNVDTNRSQIELIEHRPILKTLSSIQTYESNPLPRVFDSIGGALEMLHRSGGRGQEYCDLPWAADLTGGNDSRALMAAIIAKQINTASTVTGPASEPDVQISESLAKKLGIKHFTRIPPGPVTFSQFEDALSLTDGEFDAIEYAGIATIHQQHIHDKLQFSVNGSYGELARGHAFRMGLPGMMLPNRVSSSLCAKSPLDMQHPGVVRWGQVFNFKAESAQLFSKDALSESADYFPSILQRLLSYSQHLPQHAQLDLIHMDLRMERWLGRILSSTNQLWPALSPWGFMSPLASVLTAAPQHRRNGLLIRALIFRYAPELGVEPLYTGNPAMPFSVRHAHRFLPLIPFFADRALHKIKTKVFQTGIQDARTAQDRQSDFCSNQEIDSWIKEPLLLGSGLFDPDRLMPFLAKTRPQSDADHRVWCRLLTIEGALRRQAANSDVRLDD